MSIVLDPTERETILKQLNRIAQELRRIRRAIIAEMPLASPSFTARLLGALGSEPLAVYNFDLDWQRFAHP